MATIIIWTGDDGRVVAKTPPSGEELDATLKSVPQDRPIFVVDNANMPDAPLSTWRLDKSGKVTSVPDPLAYRAKRAAEYPPLVDLADAIVKQPEDGGAALAAYRAACKAVQAKYPKPS